MIYPLRFSHFTLCFIFATSVFNTGCATAEPIEDKVDDKFITTRITIKGDIVIGDEEPLVFVGRTAQSGDDLYGIQIYSRATDTDEKNYRPYAYGLFDSPDIAPIELLENQLYKVELAVVKNGRNVIGCDKSTTNYRLPFLLSGRGAPVLNCFTMSSISVFNGLSQGTVEVVNAEVMAGYTKYTQPMVDRYASVVNNFSPNSGSPIELLARRVVFGIRPKTEGLDQGRVDVTFTGSPTFSIHAADKGVEVEYLFGLRGTLGSYAWMNDDYTEQVTFKAVLYDAKGELSSNLTPIGGQSITVRRKSSYELLIKMSTSSSGPSISFEDPILNEGSPIIVT